MIKIKYLCEYPSVIPSLAKIWYDSIGLKWRPEEDLAEVEISFRNHLNKDALPLTYVAFDGEEPVGMCSLRSDDGPKTSLMPWLASLCIREDYRKRGIGKLLTQVVKEKAHKMGFSKLYLFTFEEEVMHWYLNDGWEKVEESTYKDRPIVIMSTPSH